MNRHIKRLKLGTSEANELSDALDRVIEQPSSAAKGNHANLCFVMNDIFKVHLNKSEAVESALYALWRENDVIQSDDPYIYQLKGEKENERYWSERADREG